MFEDFQGEQQEFNLEPREQKPSESQEAFVLPELLPEEQPEEYLFRVYRLLEEQNPDARLRHNPNMAVIDSAIHKINTDFIDQKLSLEKRAIVKQQVIEAFSPSSVAVVDDALGPDFATTNTTRMFADTQVETNEEPYSMTMFGLPFAGVGGSETVRQYIGARVDDKNIMLLGGGDSAMDLIDQEMYGDLGVHPNKILNIDKHVRAEDVRKATTKNKERELVYASAPILAEETDKVISFLAEQGVPEGVDEIWASYSVPLYLKNISDVKSVFQTIKKSLAPGGTARLYPISMSLSLMDLVKLDSIKREFADLVDEFNEDEEFKAYVAAESDPADPGAITTLIIRRLKSAA